MKQTKAKDSFVEMGVPTYNKRGVFIPLFDGKVCVGVRIFVVIYFDSWNRNEGIFPPAGK